MNNNAEQGFALFRRYDAANDRRFFVDGAPPVPPDDGFAEWARRVLEELRPGSGGAPL
jgi:hypothetical protein